MANQDRTGQQIGSYRLVQLLGSGGFADVYLGQHVRLKNMQAAIKVLHVHLPQSHREGFLLGAETIALLKHPHIIRILEFDIDKNNCPYLIMEYAPNGTLHNHHPKGSTLSLGAVVSYLKQIAEALQYAHDHKIIHLREKILVPPSVEEVVMKSLAKDPKQRFESAQAFAFALEQSLQSTPFGTTLVKYCDHPSSVDSVAWSPDGKHIASAGYNGVRVWNAANGKNVFVHNGNPTGIYSFAWSSDGKYIASADIEGAYIWNAADGKNVFVYCDHLHGAYSIAWSPDGKRIASTNYEGVYIWNVADGKNIFVYCDEFLSVPVAWSPDGKHIALADHDGVHVWQAVLR